MGACHGHGAARYAVEGPASMRAAGRKKALLVGINYRNTNAELRGCINDVVNQKQALIGHLGFAEEDIVVLSEDQSQDRWPNKAVIVEALKWLFGGAKAGDLLFFHYSGHGSQFQTADGTMADCLCPLDCISNPWPQSVILDTEIHKLLYNPLPAGCKAVAIFDCCHSGTVANLNVKREFHLGGEQTTPRYMKAPANVAVRETKALAGIRRGVVSGHHEDHQLWVFSGCQDNQTSADAYCDGQSQGAFTWALIKALRSDVWNETYVDLLDQIRNNLRGYSQVPALTTTHVPYLNFWYCGRTPKVATKESLAIDQESGTKKALLIGINYRNTPNELRGCINDVMSHKELLERHYGFEDDSMLILTEDAPRQDWPYKARIIEGFQWLLQGAQKGDFLYLSYSGHGSQMTDRTGTEPSGMSDCICPLDCDRPWPEHIVLDTEIHKYVYDRLPEGVKLVCVFDCCHSGTVANLDFKRDLAMTGSERAKGSVPSVPEYYRGVRHMEPPKEVSKPESSFVAALFCSAGTPAKMKKASGFRRAVSDRDMYNSKHVWVYSGCQDNQTSADAYEEGKYQGAFTWALTTALAEHRYCMKHASVLQHVRAILAGRYSQTPALSTTSSEFFDRYFLARRRPELGASSGGCGGL